MQCDGIVESLFGKPGLHCNRSSLKDFGCGPVDAGKCHVELHGEAEALGLARADADGCGGGCVSGNLGVLAASSDDLIACDGIIASQAGRQPLRFNRARFIFDA